ncbi:FeoA domain-containing protein [[Eubacterium] cellulosolvens]
MSELLELVKTLTREGSPARMDHIASRMDRTLKEVQRLADAATRMGLANQTPAGISLTSRGEAFVTKHREEYVHRTHIHGGSLTGRVRRFLEGNVRNWHGHWHRHGFDDESLTRFYGNMQDLQGRIEDTATLGDLREGERCTMVLALGGYRMVRRLAEMGLTPGTELRVVRTAPMHGPIQVSVRGVSLALGRGVASRVIVKRLTNGNPSTTV